MRKSSKKPSQSVDSRDVHFSIDKNFTLGVISQTMTPKLPEPLICKNYQPTLKKACGHRWYPKELDKVPDICPKCKSPNWNKPTREQRAS